jgi:hypothetical protein
MGHEGKKKTPRERGLLILEPDYEPKTIIISK